MPFYPADWTAMRAAMVAWATAGLPDYTVVWAEQDAPAPAFPYASLRIVAPPKGVGQIEETNVETGAEVLERRLERDVDFTLAVELHARVTNADARSVDEVRDTHADAGHLELYACDTDALLLLRAQDLVVRGVLGIQTLTGLGGARHESRALVELRLGARAQLAREVDWFSDLTIATVTVGDNVSGTVGA